MCTYKRFSILRFQVHTVECLRGFYIVIGNLITGVMTILCVDLGTDMWPAVALSYERAESDVMIRPPRDSDSLVSAKMISLTYGHLGLIEFAGGMFAYFFVMAEFGFYPYELFG